MPLPSPLTHTNCANQNMQVSTYTLTHPHTQTVHTCIPTHVSVHRHKLHTHAVLTYKSAHTHTHSLAHTLTNTYICTLTKLPMLTHTHTTLLTHVNVLCCHRHLQKTKSCAPSLLAQLPHLPGALTDVAVSSSVAAASPVPASVSRVCRAVSTLQSNNESCHTQRFLMFVLKFKKQPPNFSVSHTQNKSHTSEQLPAK